MKRDEHVLILYRGVFRDIMDTYPDSVKSLQRDVNRVEEAVVKLGQFFYSKEMPIIGNAFDRALSIGKSDPLGGLAHCKFLRGTLLPRFLYSLWSRVFNDEGVILAQPDPNAIFFIRQICLMFKRFGSDCPEESIKESIHEFFRQEESIRKPSLNWDGDLCDFSPGRHISFDDLYGPRASLFDETRTTGATLARRIQEVCDVVSSELGEFRAEEWKHRHGPGAVADSRTGTDKYQFGLGWSTRLSPVFPLDSVGSLNADNIYVNEIDTEIPAKLIHVPKDFRGPRLIASEPTAFQWCQQAVNNYLRDRVKESSISEAIDFDSQDRSKERARAASVDGAYCTIDLKSASDLLSCWTAERMFRANLSILDALFSCRSRFVSYGKNFCRLKKLAPMGAAFTFPVQTIFYTCVAVGSILFRQNLPTTTRNIRRLAREVQVFGDDIIAPNLDYPAIVCALEAFGFMINHRKSFHEGFFRESCGMDAYSGYDVTPVYVRQTMETSSPESITGTVATANRSFLKGLWNLSKACESILPSHILRNMPVVKVGKDLPVLNSFVGSAPKRIRFNADWQRWEFSIPILKVRNKTSKVPGIRNLLQYITEVPDPDSGWESGVSYKGKSRMTSVWVPAGLL